MKLYKYTLMALALAGFMTACSDDDNYQPGSIESAAGAYFPTTDATDIKVTEDGNSFSVKVERGDATAAATYDITTTADPEVFTVPASVSFAAEQKEALLTIGYVADSLGYDVKNPLEITIVNAGNYGNATLNMTVLVPAPWVSLGKGTYVDGLFSDFFGLEALSYEVEVQENQKAPGQFRIVDPYGKPWPYFGPSEVADYGTEPRYMYFDCTNPDEVGVPVFNTGIVDGDGGPYVNFGSYNLAMKNPDPLLWGTYVAEEGRISFPPQSFVAIEGTSAWYANTSGLTALYMPGFLPKDFATSLEYLGSNTTVDGIVYANATVTLGADVAAAKAGLVETRSLTAAANAIDEGTVETVDLTAGADQKISLEVETSGDYMIAVVAYDADGNVVGQAGQTFTATGVQPNDTWETVEKDFGMIDGWLIPALFGQNPAQFAYIVEVQQSKQRPGVYRLVNAYGEDSPVGSYNDNPSVSYIVIDATDPEFVLMEPQYSGFTMDNGLDLFITDQASYEYYVGNKDKATIKAEGIANTMVDGRITIAAPMYSPGGQGWFMSSDTATPSVIFEVQPEQPESRAAYSVAGKPSSLSAPSLNLGRKVTLARKAINAEKVY